MLVQVRHARAEVRRSITQSRSDAARELALTGATNERLNSLHDKVRVATAVEGLPTTAALMEQAGLTYAEAIALHYEQVGWWSYRTQAINYVSELPYGERVQMDNGLRYQYRSDPVFRLWYPAAKSFLNPDAVRYVDNVLAQPG